MNSSEIDQLKKEIEEVSNWKFILDNNIVKTNAGKIWIQKKKKQNDNVHACYGFAVRSR